MQDRHTHATRGIDELYRSFAVEAGATSPTWQRLCAWIAQTPSVLGRLDTLPGGKRQPNLLLGAIRLLDGPTDPHADFEDWFAEYWPALREIVLTHETQTNEPGRCAVTAPLLASLPQPVALLELGASAGLLLAPDRYRYRYEGDAVLFADGPLAGPESPVLRCEVTGRLPGDPADLRVAHRRGLDLFPLDAVDPATAAWLRALVWPDEIEREARLTLALDAVAADPVTVIRGDMLTGLDELLAGVPDGATPVVQNAAALAYLERDARATLVARLADAGVRWISLEGASVLPDVRERTAEWEPERRPHFVVALDGEPVGRCGPHGGWVEWVAG